MVSGNELTVQALFACTQSDLGSGEKKESSSKLAANHWDAS